MSSIQFSIWYMPVGRDRPAHVMCACSPSQLTRALFHASMWSGYASPSTSNVPTPASVEAYPGKLARMRPMQASIEAVTAPWNGASASMRSPAVTSASHEIFRESVSPPSTRTRSPSSRCINSIAATIAIRDPPTIRSPYG